MGHDHSDSLPYLNGDASQVTMSGFSAGCFMAHQMSIIYPDEIKGAVLASCWPYGDQATLQELETATELKDASVGVITQNFNNGLIGDPSNIANQHIYIRTGEDDVATPPVGQEAQKELYDHYSATTNHETDNDGHFPPYPIIQDGLKWVYNSLGWISTSDWEDEDSEYTNHGTYREFDQWEFFGIDSDRDWHVDYPDESQLMMSGQAFIPRACEAK